MLTSDWLVFGTVSASVVAWAVGEVVRSRWAWALGAVLMVVHSVSAFVTFYNGSHDVARMETMRQTAALTGLEFSGGIYINYVFLLVWLADAAWWVAAPASYAQRSGALSFAIRGFIFFIIVNGAVVFADGWARVLGVLAVSATTVQIVRAWHRRDTSDTAVPLGV